MDRCCSVAIVLLFSAALCNAAELVTDESTNLNVLHLVFPNTRIALLPPLPAEKPSPVNDPKGCVIVVVKNGLERGRDYRVIGPATGEEVQTASDVFILSRRFDQRRVRMEVHHWGNSANPNQFLLAVLRYRFENPNPPRCCTTLGKINPRSQHRRGSWRCGLAATAYSGHRSNHRCGCRSSSRRVWSRANAGRPPAAARTGCLEAAPAAFRCGGRFDNPLSSLDAIRSLSRQYRKSADRRNGEERAHRSPPRTGAYFAADTSASVSIASRAVRDISLPASTTALIERVLWMSASGSWSSSTRSAILPGSIVPRRSS